VEETIRGEILRFGCGLPLAYSFPSAFSFDFLYPLIDAIWGVAIDVVHIQGYSEGAEGQSYRNKGKDISIQLCVNKANLKEKWFTVVYQV
jgi:hypothetical protein